MESFDIAEFEDRIAPIMEYYKCSNYHISYFGGEPLLNWPIIESSLPAFKASSKCSTIVAISNGLELTQKKVDFLKEHNCGLSWSFDGLWSFNRPFANKSDSLEKYEKIMPLALQLTNSCKVMINPLSLDTLKENFLYFLAKGIYHPDFCLVRDNIFLQRDIEKFKIKCAELADTIIEFNQNNTLCSVGVFSLYTLDSFAGAKFGKRDHGCFVGSNGIMYAYNGEIWPCERFRSANKFKLAGFDQNGNYSYFYDNLDYLKSVIDPRDFEKCKRCELYKYCNAGCTYSQFGRDFEVVEPVDSVCEMLKICYKEGLRVYKNAGTQYQNFIHKCFENAK